MNFVSEDFNKLISEKLSRTYSGVRCLVFIDNVSKVLVFNGISKNRNILLVTSTENRKLTLIILKVVFFSLTSSKILFPRRGLFFN